MFMILGSYQEASKSFGLGLRVEGVQGLSGLASGLRVQISGFRVHGFVA